VFKVSIIIFTVLKRKKKNFTGMLTEKSAMRI